MPSPLSRIVNLLETTCGEVMSAISGTGEVYKFIATVPINTIT